MEEGLDVTTLMSIVQKERFNELAIKRAAEEARIQIEAGLIYQLRHITRSVDRPSPSVIYASIFPLYYIPS